MNKIDLHALIEETEAYVRSTENFGKPASYIPELEKANPKDLGICIVSKNKQIYKCGNFDSLFTMQSISKVLSLVLALELLGEERVFSRVGMEPTGDAFNSMIRLETQTHIPFNPMINAGAISVSGMLNDCTDFDSYLSFLRKICARDDIFVNEEVYRSERSTGMKNRAIAYFLANDGVLQNNVESVLDFYFKMCSVNINVVDLARIGSMLANDGVDVFTGERFIKPKYAIMAKTLMFTCGLYDGSGAFAIDVGFPAKSGVGGGIMCSINNNFGIGVYSPALDSKGNSVWGVRALKYLSEKLNLHSFSAENMKEYY